MKSIGIIGGGVLGKAIARGFMEHAEIKVFDKLAERRTHSLGDVARSDIVFLSLPTPSLPDGRCDASAIIDMLAACEDDGHWTPASCYVIRSTVPVGFTQGEAEQRHCKLPLLHSPEFLTARCALVDFQTPSRNIIGYPKWPECLNANRDITEVNYRARVRLHDLYQKRFPGVPVMRMHSNASELVKLASNAFFASKVTLFNLFYDFAKARGIHWEDVRDGILSDGRIAHAHTQVNEPPGYGGSCLPKDLADLFHCCLDAGVDAEVLRAIHERNAKTRGNDPTLAHIELPQ